LNPTKSADFPSDIFYEKKKENGNSLRDSRNETILGTRPTTRRLATRATILALVPVGRNDFFLRVGIYA